MNKCDKDFVCEHEPIGLIREFKGELRLRNKQVGLNDKIITYIRVMKDIRKKPFRLRKINDEIKENDKKLEHFKIKWDTQKPFEITYNIKFDKPISYIEVEKYQQIVLNAIVGEMLYWIKSFKESTNNSNWLKFSERWKKISEK